MKLKLIALLLTVCMLFSCLTACGQTKPAEDVTTPEETAAPEAESTEPPAETAPAETSPAGPYTKMFADAYAAYSPDTVVAVVGDEEITWSVYFSWLYTTLMQLSSYSIDITDFDLMIADDMTLGDFVHEEVNGMILQYGVINSKAREMKLALNEQELSEIDKIMQSDADNYYDGDIGKMMSMLSSMYITEDVYRYMTATSMLYQKLFAEFMGENGENVSEEDLAEYAAANGIYKAKHILLKTVDDSYQPLDEETVSRKHGEIEELLKELKALPADQLEARIDEMIREVGEDPGSLAYPDGYYFAAGQAVAEFEETANALEIGQVSDIVESSYGYHIIYRPAMHGDDIYNIDTSTGAVTTLRQAVTNALFSNIANEWFTIDAVSFTDGFEDLPYDELLVLPETAAADPAGSSETAA